MALDISSLPPVAEPLPARPSRLLWAVVFFVCVFAGMAFMLLIWPKRLATGTPLFWVWVVVIPAVAAVSVVLVRFAIHATPGRSARSWNVEQRKITTSAYRRESVAVALLAGARRISMKAEQNALSKIVSRDLKLLAQTTPDNATVVMARWFDAPALPAGTPPTRYDAERQDALLEPLFASLLADTAGQIKALPENLPLVIKVHVTAPSARVDVRESFIRTWKQHGLRETSVDIDSEAPDLMALDAWLDETGQAREHATLLVVIKLNDLVSRHPPKKSTEGAVALLMAPDEVAQRMKLRPLARIYRPRQGVLAGLAQTLNLAMKWGNATTDEIHQVWHCGFDESGQKTLMNTLRENGIDLKEGEHALDLAVGDSGSLSPWLALACAYEHAVGYGGAQLIARYGDSHAVLGIVRPVIHASQSAGL